MIQVLGEPRSLPNRKLNEETCRKYRALFDGKVLRFYYTDKGGQITGAKIRQQDKVFSWEGSNPDSRFFGQQLFPPTGKRVVITEGEFDAMSCYQAMPGWPMVSIPNGAQAAKKAIQKQMEWLQGYEEVVLFFDSDDAGRAAAAEAASVLPPGKVKIASLADFKDASEALVAGQAEEIKRAIWNAKSYRPDGIVEGKSLLSVITQPTESCLHEYPYKGLQSKLHGIRSRELITVTAGSGIGKSSFCRELATHLLTSGERVGYLALEESNRRTALGLMSCHAGKPFHLGEQDPKELKEVYDDTLAQWNLFLFDGFGSYDPDVIYNRIEYLASGLEVRVVFLDHLSILLSGLDGDERRTIDITMTRLRSLVERTGITLFLVCHVSGDDNGKPYEEGGRIKLNKLRGSRSIGQLSDAVIALERDQQSERGGDETTVRVLKNRYSGEVGVASRISYDLSTCRYNELSYEAEEPKRQTDYEF
jgi:twinkle protein